MRRSYKRLFLFIIASELFIMGIVGVFILPELINERQIPIMLGIAAATILFTIGVPFLFLRPLLHQESIAEKGQKAVATLLEFWDTGVTINDDPQVKMQVEVHPKGGSSYQAELKTIISRLSVGLLKPGARLLVSYLPERPDDLALISINDSSSGLVETGQPGAQALQEVARKSRLAELEELHDRHMIGDSDYRRRRDELLSEVGE
jgi:hypothetical protein